MILGAGSRHFQLTENEQVRACFALAFAGHPIFWSSLRQSALESVLKIALYVKRRKISLKI